MKGEITISLQKDEKMYSQTGNGESSNETVLEYAGFWRRFAAMMIDSFIIIFIPFFIFTCIDEILRTLTGSYKIFNTSDEVYLNILLIVVILFNMTYRIGMEASPLQATLGKMIVKIAVTDTNGARISLGKATARQFAKFISFMVLLVGCFMAGFTKKKQALHDIMTNCLVVKRESVDSKVILWKVYFWFGVVSLFGYPLSDMRVWEFIDLAAFILAMAGLYAFIWKKNILNKLIWKTFLPVYVIWVVIYLYLIPFQMEDPSSQPLIATASMVFSIPLFIALYLYGFKREL